MKKVINIFKVKEKKPTTDFSDFFHNASAREEKKFFKTIIREANQDQLNLIKKASLIK